MKQTLIGILTFSCVLSAPSWNKIDNFQNLQLEIGQPAEAAPKFRMPPWVGQVIRGVGKKALTQELSATLSALGNNSTRNRMPSPAIGHVGNLCKSDAGIPYIMTASGEWIYNNGSEWTSISHPSHSVTCYIDLSINSSGNLDWSYSAQVFKYIP